jgi:thiamine-phosphate pyrophosphorylase
VRPLPPLYAIVDVAVAARAGRDPVDLAAAFLAGGAALLQIRAKDLASGPFLELCTAVVGLARGHGASIIVNDRADLARLAGAHGVHVGQEDLTPADVRTLLGPDAIVGLSTHTVAQIEQARREPISYLAVGPVFGTGTKATGYDAVGAALATEAARRIPHCPIVAIGGVTLDNATTAWTAGAHSVAVITDLLSGGDPRARVASYNRLADAHFRGSRQP